MKMFKRIAAVVLAGVMAVGMMTACGSNSLTKQFDDAVTEYFAAVSEASGVTVKNDAALAASVYEHLGHIENGALPDSYKVYGAYMSENDMEAQMLKDLPGMKAGDTKSYTVYYINDPATGKATELTDQIIANVKAMTKAVKAGTADDQAETIKHLETEAVAVGTAAREVNGKTYVGVAVTYTATAVEPASKPIVVA